MMLGMQDDKRLPNDLATAHEVIRVQSELHKSLQEALAERRRVRAERRHSSSRRGRATIRKWLIGDFDAMLGSSIRSLICEVDRPRTHRILNCRVVFP
jgi:hypothetical protein